MAAILNIDHNDKTRLATTAALAENGWTVHDVAYDGDVFESLSRHRPDVVLLRLREPDGSSVYRKLRENGGHESVMVLRMTSEETVAPHPVGEDFDALLPDQADSATVLRTVRCLLRLREAQREAHASAKRSDVTAQQLHRSRQEFESLTRRVRHDLEEPLRAMNTFVQLVEERVGELAEPEKTFQSHVINSIGRTRALLDDLVTYAQVGLGAPDRQRRFSLKAVAVAALQQLDSQIRGGNVSVHVQEPLPLVYASFAQLQQVFEILMSNAIQYRRPGEPLRISIGRRDSAGESIVFVSDNGMGIDPQYHESIFQPLQRLHGNRIPGTGMGLAICKRIVELHGGRIWVESKLDAGAIFYIALPSPPE